MAKQRTQTLGRDVYVVDGARTPFLKAKGKPGIFSASDLAVAAGKPLLARQPFAASSLDEVILGCMMPSPDEANIARVVALRLGCGKGVPAFTVQRNCASGMQAIDNAMQDIASGRHDLVLAGGTEAMSRAPLLYNESMVNWLSSWYAAKNMSARLKVISRFKLSNLAPVVALLRGLSDPLYGLSMGQTAEKVACQFGITREEMDDYALCSHQRIAAAEDGGYMTELVPLYGLDGQVIQQDEGIRRDTSLEKLASLKPFFDKKFGLVTAGNSSQVSDGAVLLLLASADAVKRYNLPVLGRIADVEWAGVDPTVMGLGPVNATVPMLQRQQLTMQDIDYWELNEAFAAQVLGCIRAWADDNYCKEHFGLANAFGHLDQERLSVDGGAVAIGHPVGASGARIVLHLLHVLKRKGAQRGVATICIGGGQGGAMLVENVDEVQA
jgi:acetyl-CoA C-acetyltransferase